jgi:hypothetical protein
VTFAQVTTAGSTAVAVTTYGLTRYPAAGGAGVAVTASCSGTGTMKCSETSVPDGSWQYTDAPTMGSWTGGESAKSAAVTVDATAPTVVSVNRGGTSPTNTGPLAFTVTFSEAVSSVAASNFGLATSAITGTPVIATPSGSAPTATWSVNVTTTGVTSTNTGSIGLNLTGAGTIADASGNVLATPSFTGQTYTYDTAAPTVTLNQAAGQADPTSVAVHFTATFSEAVTALPANGTGVVLGGTAGRTSATVSVTTTDTSHYDIAVSGLSSSGTITASLSAAATTDLVGNTSAASTSTDNTVTFNLDITAPPTPAISVPAANGDYCKNSCSDGSNPTVWGTGISGTEAADTGGSGLASIEVSIRLGTGNYWNGTSFSSSTQAWNVASGTSAWSYAFAYTNFPALGTYTVTVRAKDAAGNVTTSAARSMTWLG